MPSLHLTAPLASRNASIVLRAALLALLLAASPAALAADTDGDGIDDAFDTCREVAHPNQADPEGDGFGGPCDCDLDGDGFCNLDDFGRFLPAFVRGSDAGSGADLSGDGAVNIDDFVLFLPGFLAGRPGPGATGAADPAAVFSGVDCEGSAPDDLCRIWLAPGLVLEALREQLAALTDGLHVSGDVRVPAHQGLMLLGNVTLVIQPGDGPFGFDTVRGTATLTAEFDGLLGTIPIEAVVVDVGLDRGENIAADVPLQPDLHYLLFRASAGFDLDLGPVFVEGPGGAMTLLFNPEDPFFYAGAEVTNLPIPLPAGGLFFLSLGGGIGFSQQGLIPFAPATTAGIAALFPSFDGHLVQWALGELPTCPGCPTLQAQGYAITDLDPQADGLALFGPAETGGDLQLGINGLFTLSGGIGALSVEVDLFEATGGLVVAGGELSTFVGGRTVPHPEIFDFSLAEGFSLVPTDVDEFGIGAMLSSDPTQRFLRIESRHLSVGAPGVVQATNVTVSDFMTEEFFFQTGGSGTFLGGTTTAQSVVAGVRALETTSFELSFPSNGVSELVMRSRYELGREQLRQSTLWLSPERIAQEGLYDMPNYTFLMYGEHTDAGARLQGTLDVPIPYSYPALEAVLYVADQIDQQEAAVARAQQEAAQAQAALATAQSALSQAQSGLAAAQSAFNYARNELDDHYDAIEDAENIDCGCSRCGLIDAVCWFECGVCEASQEATLFYLRGLTAGIERAYDLAQSALRVAQGVVGSAQTRLSLAQNLALLTSIALDDALAALAELYAQRENLPQEDGVFDATVTLTLTETDLTGSVGGDFQGAPVGAGTVYTEGAPRACFTPPAPGAPEFCTLL